MNSVDFLLELESTIDRRLAGASESSYTLKLAASGLPAVARKVGEEGLEVALASVTESDDRLVDEAADLLFHLLVLLRVKGLALSDVTRRLEQRHAERTMPPQGAER